MEKRVKKIKNPVSLSAASRLIQRIIPPPTEPDGEMGDYWEARNKAQILRLEILYQM